MQRKPSFGRCEPRSGCSYLHVMFTCPRAPESARVARRAGHVDPRCPRRRQYWNPLWGRPTWPSTARCFPMPLRRPRPTGPVYDAGTANLRDGEEAAPSRPDTTDPPVHCRPTSPSRDCEDHARATRFLQELLYAAYQSSADGAVVEVPKPE